MTRTLRPRKSRPSYATSAGYELHDDDTSAQAGPSTTLDDEDSGSNFAPEANVTNVQDDPSEASEELVLDPELDPENNEMVLIEDAFSNPVSKSSKTVLQRDNQSSRGKSKGKGKEKAVPDTMKSTSIHGTSLSRPSKMYALPTPSVHHRHRAVPLFCRLGRVERLSERPVLFGPSKVIPTNSFTQNMKVADRLNKAWGFNVGSGPLWDLVEDRGWYKEALENVNAQEREANRRPRVCEGLRVQRGWQILNIVDATPYLPTDTITTDEGNFKPPPPITCSFGPYGNQTRIQVEMFQTHKMSEFIPESKSHIFSAGAPVWGLDWCPIHPDDRRGRSYKQYLAVAPFPSRSHSPEIGVRALRPSYACIQIWSLNPSQPVQSNPSKASKSKELVDSGEMRCEMVLCLDGGPAHELKWCPLPSHDHISESKIRPRKLGVIAGTFEDGSFSVYVVPDPLDVTPPDHDSSLPVFVKLPDPILRIELEETSCWAFDWANSELIAIGTTNGAIAVYNLGPVLKVRSVPDLPPITQLLPTHYLTVHQSAIRALAWIRAPPSWPSGIPRTDDDPTVIASGGYDGLECLTDIREGHGSTMNRTRDVINTMTFSPFAGGPITIDHENIVKAYSASPSMMGRGHMLLEPQGPIWTVNASDYHPQLAIGSADGSCVTTNTLRSTRRGGSVPFFVHKLYQLDYSRNLKEYRMLERFLPQEIQDRPTAARAAKSNKAKSKEPIKVNFMGTGAWSPEVGIHRVTWNNGNGLAASRLLASASASGLCRIDLPEGRWMKDKVPYRGVAEIRRESDVGVDLMDVDSEESPESD